MIRINLLKPETKIIKKPSEILPLEFKEEKKKPLGSLIFLLLIIVCVAFFLLQRKTFTSEENLLIEAKQEKRNLEDVLVKLDTLQQQRDLFERKINLINQLKFQQGTAVTIMDQISKNIPDWVWLSEANYNNQIVNIKGLALSNNLIADYIYNLENSPHFSNVNLISSTQRTIQNNRCVEFSLNATYILPPGVMSSSEEISQKERP